MFSIRALHTGRRGFYSGTNVLGDFFTSSPTQEENTVIYARFSPNFNEVK